VVVVVVAQVPTPRTRVGGCCETCGLINYFSAIKL